MEDCFLVTQFVCPIFGSVFLQSCGNVHKLQSYLYLEYLFFKFKFACLYVTGLCKTN